MSELRRQARRRRREMGLDVDIPHTGETVVGACLAALGLQREFAPPGDSALAGAIAVLNVTLAYIVQDETRTPAQLSADAAHEIAHAWLHAGSAHGTRHACLPAEVGLGETGEAPGAALSKVDGYSPKQRREREANEFAAELLLPGPLARQLFFGEKLSSEAIASRLGLPPGLVQAQLAEALLLPETPEKAASAAASAVALDPSQQAAAEAACGPLLVGAGPGTGKTKTLVERCRFLTGTLGVPAEKILALTFSRKAAAEMKERLLAAGVGTENAGPWVGTFHAFGLEVLRRFGEALGLPASGPVLLDQLDAVTLLENHLPELQLDALDNLYNPAVHLGGILRQIGRAKDELCSPERYAALCAAMAADAEAERAALAARSGKVLVREQDAVDKAVENAQKAAEVARCYAVYERLLAEHGFLDFGDLIRRTVQLLEERPDVLAALQAEYPQVLADEYQDVNRACAHLVRRLAGESAAGLWAVGDHRQSIYQFQGASPANVAAFERDYPAGVRRELAVNYRSRAPIVDCFGRASGGGDGWHAHRGHAEGSGGFPAVTVAASPDDAGQARGIAAAMRALRAAGHAFQDQAVLCRTHSQAEALAAALSELDIPVLYLGALLERPEVKDLLCLLTLLADPAGAALHRVAAWPEYAVPLPECLALLAGMRRLELPLLDALADASLHPGLIKLGRHLRELETMDDDPAALLRFYLFGQSEYLARMDEREPKPFKRVAQRLALHQLLGLAAGFQGRVVTPKSAAGPPGNVRAFLAHLRRLSAAGAAPRGILPPEAETLDAVRLLTAHAAKGLEFPVVFVPNLAAGQFPARGRADGIPEPPGLTAPCGDALDEEACLFFVALSRAREHLILSRSERKAGSEKPSAPSPLLASLGLMDETLWPAGSPPPPEDAAAALPETPDPLPEYSQSALESYGRCPRQYFYSHVLKLPGASHHLLLGGGGYPQFLSCVRTALNWQEDRQAAGESVSPEVLSEKLDAVWAESGPVGHLHEEKYLTAARHMLAHAGNLSAGGRKADTRTLTATLTNCRVSVRPDVLRVGGPEGDGGTLIVARRLTGKPGKDDHTDKKLALYRRAAADTHPGRTLHLSLHYLADGLTVPLDPPHTRQQAKWEEGRVAKYEQAAAGIGRGAFPAQPGDECARCPYSLLCPE